MNESPTLRCDLAGPVATLTLDRPRALNALNEATLRELRTAVDNLAARPEVRVLLLTGAGDRAFAAGADIRDLLETDPETGRTLSELGQTVFSRLESCGKPVIACLNGVAFGGGLELAMACTFRLAAEHARFGLPEAKLGLIPGFGGIQRLVRSVGRSAALRMMLTGDPITAPEALRLGLVDEVVPAAELLPRAIHLATTIAQLAPLAIQGTLEAVQRQDALLPTAQCFALEAEIFGRLCGSADKREGLTAFLEKRPPAWQGS
jgi:enoyl-CoA hydratase